MSRWVRVAAVADVPSGQVKTVQVEGKALALCHAADGWYAVDDLCTHDDGPLGEGLLDGHQIECPRHGARFDVRTGAVTCLPAVMPIRAYGVRVQGTDVLVDLG